MRNPGALVGRAALTVAVVAALTAGAAPVNAPAPPSGEQNSASATAERQVDVDSVTWNEGGGETGTGRGGHGDLLQPSPDGGATPEYQTGSQVWERTDLTYGFDNWTPDLSHSQIRAAVASALETWSSVSPLTFTEVADCGLPHNHPGCTSPDIRIVFGTGDHGAGSNDPDFDGVGGVVAHAFGPAPDFWNFTAAGDIHLDDAETWKVNGSAVDLETVVLHESGHSLGISHTDKSCSAAPGPNRPIMCPVLTGIQHVLAADDIAAIQSLYGPPADPLPDGVEVAILAPNATTTESGSGDQLIRIANGHPNPLAGASLDVTGIDGCDRPTIAVPAKSVVYSSCPIDPSAHLSALDTSTTLTLSVKLSADGIPDAADGPTAVTVVAADHPFTDVPAWVDPAVDWIAFWGLADGYGDNTYRPDNDITRAQVTRMLWRHAGEPTVGGTHPFIDVPDWVDDAVAWAAFDPPGGAEPLVDGYTDGTFRPDEPISRAAVVRLLYRYAGSPTVGTLPGHGFPDVPDWVEDAVRWAAHDPDSSGPLEVIANGFADGTFGPYEDISRAQVTRMVFRLTDQLID